jgi:hypothetical protein
MIELHDLSSDESDGAVSNVNHVSSNAYISSGQCSSSSIIYNACSIKTFLKEQPGKYVLVENHKVNHVEPFPLLESVCSFCGKR